MPSIRYTIHITVKTYGGGLVPKHIWVTLRSVFKEYVECCFSIMPIMPVCVHHHMMLLAEKF